jgi:TetR/AcrR family transcriptional regulator, regulator of autoinduction and epiphytic fitness
MSGEVKPRRPYRSPGRAAAAAGTRVRIVEAARALFLERGFADTTITAIAGHARVAPETVYSIYRTKAGLLDAVLRTAVLRNDEPENPLERSWVQHLLRRSDVHARIAGFARHTAQTTELTSPIYAIIASAGTGDSEIDELQRNLLDMRFGGQREIITALLQGGSLRPGLTADQAADTFSAIASPELHHLLRVSRGWSRRRYARWLEQTVKVALLEDPSPAATP